MLNCGGVCGDAHLPADEHGLFTVHLVVMLAMVGYIGFYVKLLLDQKKQLGQIHLVAVLLGVYVCACVQHTLGTNRQKDRKIGINHITSHRICFVAVLLGSLCVRTCTLPHITPYYTIPHHTTLHHTTPHHTHHTQARESTHTHQPHLPQAIDLKPLATSTSARCLQSELLLHSGGTLLTPPLTSSHPQPPIVLCLPLHGACAVFVFVATGVASFLQLISVFW